MSLTRTMWLAPIVVFVQLVVSLENVRAEEPAVFPQQARDRYEKGRDLQQKGLLDDAIRAYEEAIKMGMKDYPRVNLYRADSNRDLKKFDLAIQQYSQFLDKFSLEESCRY